MTSLELGNPPIRRGSSVVPDADPVARPVVLWVGITDQTLVDIRSDLPEAAKALLRCCDQGFKHILPLGNGESLEFKRIRYAGRPIGYGIVISTWMTIKPNNEIPADFMKDEKLRALRILRSHGLSASSTLTDRV